MTAATYDVRLVEQRPEANGVATFRFERPSGYGFLPGQHLSLTIGTRDGEQTKYFTVCSAPPDPWLEITTRLTGSAFKDALAATAAGDLVRISDAAGRMILPQGTSMAAFLVGGVGVTPARSIVRDAVEERTRLAAALFYGNLDQDNIPFEGEFRSYAEAHPEILLVDVLLSPKPGWAGETGYITADVVRRHVDPLAGWHFVIAGPPPMIEPMQRVLEELSVPAERVSLESFAGYR